MSSAAPARRRWRCRARCPQETRYPRRGPSRSADTATRQGDGRITRAQLARFSLVHHELVGVPTSPCNIVAQLLSAKGKLLAGQSFQDGAGVHLDLAHPGGLGVGLRSRLELFAHVLHTPGRLVGATLELIDRASGQTQVPTSPCNFPTRLSARTAVSPRPTPSRARSG